MSQAGKYKQWRLNEHGGDGGTFIKFSPNSQLFVIALKRSIKIFKLDYNRFLSEEVLVYHSDFEVEDIKWSPDSKALLIISIQCTYFVLVQNIHKTEDLTTYRIQQPPPAKLIFIDWVPDSKCLILVSSCNIFSCVHRICDGRKILIPSICSTKEEKPLLAFSSDGKYLASITYHAFSYHIALLSASLWVTLWMKKLELFIIKGLRWSQNSDMFAIWDYSKKLIFFDLNGENVHTLHYDDPFASGFLFTLFSRNLLAATCFKDNEKVNLILLYNLGNWQLSAILEEKFNLESSSHLHAANKLAFSHCGNFLASSLSDDALMLWNLKECCNPCKLTNLQHKTLQWHPRKAKFASSAGNQIFIWECNQDGPMIKTKMYSVVTEMPSADTFVWAKKNLILQNLQSTVILVRDKERKKFVNNS